MATRLTPRDLKIHRMMRDAEVLENIEGHQLDASKGIVLVSCFDPFRREDIITFKERVLLQHCSHKLICPILFPGGALRLWERSPANTRGSSLHVDMLEAIKIGLRVLDTKTVALYCHAPCTLAREVGIDFLESADILFKAKEYLKRKIPGDPTNGIPGVNVACFMHVDRSTDEKVEMNTYFMRRATYYPWRQLLNSGIITVS